MKIRSPQARERLQDRLNVTEKFVEALDRFGKKSRLDSFGNVLPALFALHRIGHLLVEFFEGFHADGELLITKGDRRAHHAGCGVHAFIELFGPQAHARASRSVFRL